MDSKNKPDWFKGKWLKRGGNVKSYVDGKEYKLSTAQLSIFDEMGGIWLVIEMTDPNAKEAIKNLKEGFNKCVEWWIINDIKLMRSLFTAKQLNIGVDVLPTLENKETKYVDANSIEYFDKIISLCKRRELRFDDIEQYKQEAQNEFYMDKLDVIGELGFKELDNTLEHLKTFSTAMIYGQCKAFSAMVNPEYEKNTYQHFFAMTGLDIGGEATYKKFLYDSKFSYVDFNIIALNYKKASDIAKACNCRMLKIFCDWKWKVSLYAYTEKHPSLPGGHISWTPPKPLVERNYKLPFQIIRPGNKISLMKILLIVSGIMLVFIILMNILK